MKDEMVDFHCHKINTHNKAIVNKTIWYQYQKKPLNTIKNPEKKKKTNLGGMNFMTMVTSEFTR